MTPLTGRALAAVVLAALLAGCGAGSGADGGRERGAGAPARSATTAPPAEGAGGAVRPLAR
ncbi:class F sortase, partial [Streptomyces rochei]